MLLDDMIILDKLSILQKFYGIRRYHKVGHKINIAEEHCQKVWRSRITI